jgi:mannose-6-phosphate isomerase-like protein (cupin superfamily)
VTDYTIKNLKGDVDDQAPQAGLTGLEARFARDVLDCQNFGLSYQRLEPDVRNPFGHRHREQEEVYVILEGGGRVKLDDEIRDVRLWDAVRVGKDTIRCFEAGPERLAFLAFGAPKTSGRDAEMIPDWWSD